MRMNKMLSFALEAAGELPEEMQDEIGRALLEHVRNLQQLKAEVDAGIVSLQQGRGRQLAGAVWREMKAEAVRQAGTT